MVIPLTYGRMGNFLFQAAAAIGYAKQHGLDFTLPNKTEKPIHNPIYLQHLVRKDFDPTLPKITVEEKQFHFNPIPFQEEWRNGHNIVLDGYWQSEKYFKSYRDDVLSLFNYPWRKHYRMVSVHVRRGDYLRLVHKHPPVSVDWIRNAMAQFPEHAFLFFSDDIAWCKQTFGKRSDCAFSEGGDPEQDLIHMSWCEHHICSASTFSWWGAWLNRNPDKRVLLPKLWYMPGHGGFNTQDIVPPEWERI